MINHIFFFTVQHNHLDCYWFRKPFECHGEKIVQYISSVAQSCSTLCDSMDCSTPRFPVFHHLPELAETHFHWVSDAIQSSHALSSHSPPAFNICQHQDHLINHTFKQIKIVIFRCISKTDLFYINSKYVITPVSGS